MRVYLAAKVLSRTMRSIVQDEVRSGRCPRLSRNHPSKETCDSIIELIGHVDRLTDICNTASNVSYPKADSPAKPFQPVPSFCDEQVGYLLETLDYFQQWQADLAAAPELSAADASSSFFSTETTREIVDVSDRCTAAAQC